MIILDVETTGTDPNIHSLVSIGAVDFNNPDIRFMEECLVWPGAEINEGALSVNGFTREEITFGSKKSEAQITQEFLSWLSEREDMVIAGQNVFFDIAFIRAAAKRGNIPCSLSHRIVDLHSVCFAHMMERGIEPPLSNKKTGLDSDAIMHYVGLEAEPKPHIALNGALYEAEAFSRLLKQTPLLPQFESQPIPWKK